MITNLTLKNFTVFTGLTLELSPKINVIIGENGTGKTHLLKAAYGLCAGAPLFKNKPDTGDDELEAALTAKLLPMAEVLTPNIPEAEILSGMTISDAAGMEAAAKAISEKYGCAVLCKGGHQINDADDLLWRSGTGKWFHGKRIANPNTHGTGCTLSSAIASNLAKGCDLHTSVERAKAYISGCLSAMLDLGHGSGPMDHMFALKGEFVDG